MGSTASDDGWDWTFSPRADDQFAQLDAESQRRIVSKLDEVVSSDWREHGDFLEPLTNSPYQKLRVGDYRLGCRLLQDDHVLASGNGTARTRPTIDPIHCITASGAADGIPLVTRPTDAVTANGVGTNW